MSTINLSKGIMAKEALRGENRKTKTFNQIRAFIINGNICSNNQPIAASCAPHKACFVRICEVKRKRKQAGVELCQLILTIGFEMITSC